MSTVTEIHNAETCEIMPLPIQQGIVRPAISSRDALAAWHEYQELKNAIAEPQDFQLIKTKNDPLGKPFPKKSLWRKLATFFNLSIEMVSEKEIVNQDGSIDFDVVYKAIAPNGRSCVGDGSCNSTEKSRVLSRHDTRSTASTRAFNRAVSNLIGGGEVSADEFKEDDFIHNPPPPALNPKKPIIESENPAPADYQEPGKKPSAEERKAAGLISEGQEKRFWAISKTKNLSTQLIREILKKFNYQEAYEIKWQDYKAIIEDIERP